jgi:hypothetical protein
MGRDGVHGAMRVRDLLYFLYLLYVLNFPQLHVC